MKDLNNDKYKNGNRVSSNVNSITGGIFNLNFMKTDRFLISQKYKSMENSLSKLAEIFKTSKSELVNSISTPNLGPIEINSLVYSPLKNKIYLHNSATQRVVRYDAVTFS